jgi:hypothetical protein
MKISLNILQYSIAEWPAIVMSVWRLTTGWMDWASNPSGGEIYHTHPDRAHPVSCMMCTRYFPEGKWLRHDMDHKPPSSIDVKERLELHLFSPSGPSWPFLGWILPLPLSYSITEQLTFILAPAVYLNYLFKPLLYSCFHTFGSLVIKAITQFK